MIRKLLEWILGIDFSLCKHDFVLQEKLRVFKYEALGAIEKLRVFKYDALGAIKELPQKTTLFYLCKKCGKEKIITIK